MPNLDKRTTKGGRIDETERERRLVFALKGLGATGTTIGLAAKIMAEFEVGRGTARRILRDAKTLVKMDVPTIATIERVRMRALLSESIEATAPDSPVRITAIKAMIDLLGLAAPQQIEARVIATPFNPLDAYAGNPDLLARAMQLERDASNACDPVDAVEPGQDCFPGMAVPASPSGGGSLHDGHSDESDQA